MQKDEPAKIRAKENTEMIFNQGHKNMLDIARCAMEMSHAPSKNRGIPKDILSAEQAFIDKYGQDPIKLPLGVSIFGRFVESTKHADGTVTWK